MRTLVWGVFFIFLGAGIAGAANNTASQHDPVEITSTGETTYENGIATARDNVAIHIGDTDIYGDFAQYNSRTHEVSVEGHVRIYRDPKPRRTSIGWKMRLSPPTTPPAPIFTCTPARCAFMKMIMLFSKM